MSDNKTSFKNYIQGAALLLLIVVLPMGSWYFLQAGFDYNKGVKEELKDYGRMPDFRFVDQNGDTLTRKEVEGKVVVVDFFNSSNPSFQKTVECLEGFHKQFGKRKDVVFLSHTLNPETTSSSNLKSIAKEAGLDNDQCYFLSGDRSAVLETLVKGYKIPDFSKIAEDKTISRSSSIVDLPVDYPYFILIDVSGTIRNYYDINDEKAKTRLTEHIAIILPRTSEEKAVLKREKEK